MATPAATPQAFRFGSQTLTGNLVRFSGQNKRRHAVQEYLKRRGARVEDNEVEPRRLDVDLVFTGATCASDYTRFAAELNANPYGLLTHPIAGQWFAFCTGPSESVDLNQALDRISVRVEFVESSLSSTTPQDAPSVATAQQQATATLTSTQQAVATFMGEIAKAQATTNAAFAAIDNVLDEISTVSAPLDVMLSAVRSTAAAGSSIIGTVTTIYDKMAVLEQDVQNYVNAATDTFDGTPETTAVATSSDVTIAGLDTTALAFEDTLIASTSTPAGAAEVVGMVEETLAACYVLDAAVQASQPPVVLVTVPGLTDLISFCVERYGAALALARASVILGLNRIPNPAAIPGGFKLRIPSR